jgi:hypothetical protein
MPNVMTWCPTLQRAVPTGVTTEMVRLDTLQIASTFHCPLCGRDHTWQRADAWVDGCPPPPRRPTPQRVRLRSEPAI